MIPVPYQRLCCAQILEQAVLEENRMQGQIKREIHILKQLHHPNIVDLKEVMASKESIFLVMELVPGGELFDRILLDGAMKVTPFAIAHVASLYEYAPSFYALPASLHLGTCS